MSQADEVFQRKNVRQLLRLIADLHRDLGVAFDKKSQKRKELWPATRNDLTGALVAIAWFFKRLEGFDAYSHVFNEFSTALADLDHGTIHAIFAVKARRGGEGKPPDSTDIVCARCRVAIALTYLMRAEPSKRIKQDVAAEIAANYRELERLMQKRADRPPNLARSIVTWYNQFNKGDIKHQEARDLFRSFKHALAIAKRSKSYSSSNMILVAHRQLRLAAEFVPMTVDEALGLSNFIEQKRTLQRPPGGRRRRGV